ncbi:hypothetical protein POTOM_002024 [Populus tomentosa]|uniref:Uncharacterized protein n=1 Tax=Populus tomentosa TaxID=118781 RepID=A0A8X8DIX9_POPTO|nr:hypothetical protein POTOM_002024 [Populus tomentosa]
MHRRGNSRCKASSSNQNMTCEAAGTTNKSKKKSDSWIALLNCEANDGVSVIDTSRKGGRRPLSAARGVKIVITTRNDGVPSIMGGFISHHHLEALSEYDCLSVFAHHVLEKQNLMQSKSASFWQWSPGLDEAIHQCLIVSTLRLSNTDHFAVSMEEYSTNEQGSSHGLAALAVEKQGGIPDLGALFVSSFCRAFGWLG